MKTTQLKSKYYSYKANRPYNMGKLLMMSMLTVLLSMSYESTTAQVTKIETKGKSNLPYDQEEEFKMLILKEINLLTGYISVIADKDLDRERRQDAITLAVKQFINDDKIVQVSSKNRPTKNVPVRIYFTRLYAIEAIKVKITSYEIAKLTEITKGKDGNFHAVAQFYQLFESFDGEGRLIYSDKTIKKVQVVLKGKRKFTGAGMQDVIEVKLGDINVVETI